TLGILNSAGIHLVGPRIDNNFYDLSFKLHHKGKKHQFSLWGIGGSSLQRLNRADTLRIFPEYRIYDWTTDMGVIGATWNYLIDDKSYIRSNVAFSGQRLFSQEDTISLLDGELSSIDEESVITTQLSTNTFYKRTFNNRLNLKVGTILTRYGFDMSHRNSDFVQELETIYDVNSSTSLAQGYAQFSFRPNEKWMINVGAHAMYLGLNGTSSVQPRISGRYTPTPTTSIAFSYGGYSRVLPWDIYFTDVNGTNPNLDLELMKSTHYILAFDQMLGKTWRVHVETYLQQLSDVPVVDDPTRKIWLLNRVNGYNRDRMLSEGTGQNVGVDVSLEKFFEAGAFFVLSGSIFNSTFQVPNDPTVYSTRFNGRYTANFTGGRTFQLSDHAAIETSMRLIYSAGNPVLPLQPGTESIAGRRPYWDFSNPYLVSVGTYFRPDLRVAFRKNNRRSAYWLALDIQNFINRVNRDAFEYDYNEQTLIWENRAQAALTPLITFWIDF
ncbi:MAG: TonB-dependent receptor, partial [Bacteroidota bacterium]